MYQLPILPEAPRYGKAPSGCVCTTCTSIHSRVLEEESSYFVCKVLTPYSPGPRKQGDSGTCIYVMYPSGSKYLIIKYSPKSNTIVTITQIPSTQLLGTWTLWVCVYSGCTQRSHRGCFIFSWLQLCPSKAPKPERT